MKKLLLILVIMIAAPISANAAVCNYGCVEPYDLTSGCARFLSSATGQNFLAKKIAGSILKKQIKKSVDSDLKIKIDSYSIRDLKAGRFKSLEISGKNLNADGVYLSELELKTLCNFNYIIPDEKNNTITFKEAFPLSFKAVISDDDLNKTMKTVGYDRVIEDLNKLGGKYGLFKILSAQTKVKNDRFFYMLRVTVPFYKPVYEVVISSDLTVKNGVIKFEDTKLINNSFTADLSKLSYVINYLNPLDYSLQILENKDARLKLKDVSIENNKIIVDGTVTVPKDIVTER